MILYDYLPSQNAWKVRLLLSHLEQSYEQRFVSIFEGEGQRADYLAINPTGSVPALQFGTGEAIAESNAILAYLAHGTEYLPSDSVQQAKILQWLFFESDYVQSSVATLRYWKLTKKDVSRSENLLSSKLDASNKVMSLLNARLSDYAFLAGSDYTIADISVFAYTHLCKDAGVDLNKFDSVQRWIEAVKSQPRFSGEVFSYSTDKYSCREL